MNKNKAIGLAVRSTFDQNAGAEYYVIKRNAYDYIVAVERCPGDVVVAVVKRPSEKQNTVTVKFSQVHTKQVIL